jgi:acid phosphatase class B
MSFLNWLKVAKPGYGVVMVLMILVSSLLLASAFKFTRGNALNTQIKALQNNSTATQVANYGLEAFKAYIVTQLKAGTAITTSYRYPSSGTNNVSVPDDPSNLAGASSTIGTYYGTVTQVRGNYYLLSVTAVSGTSTVTASKLVDITIASSTVGDMRFIGRNAGDASGSSVSGTVDVDGDGYNDLLMGANLANGGGSDSGEAYLVLGRSNTAWKSFTDTNGDFNLDNLSDANMTVRFIGRVAGDQTGYSISGAGDVNNDGYDDIVIGAIGASGSGEAYLVLGRSKTDWQALTDASGDFNLDSISDANLMVRFIGRNAGDQAGFSVSGGGDVNNDGYDDIVIGADESDGGGASSGEVYLVLGRSTTDWATLTPTTNGDFNLTSISDANLMVRFIGRAAGDNVGTGVSILGDVNNDGYDDIVIGASWSDGGGSNSGEAYLILGRSTTDWATLTPTTNGDFNLTSISDANLMVRFIGRAAGDATGVSVSDFGDVNNDGYDDIVIGATVADGGGSNSGEAYLILGRSTTDWATLTPTTNGDFNLTSISDANLMVRFIGRAAGDATGVSVSDFGDVNNDGYDDIVIGATVADGGGSGSGEAYLILGRSTTDWATLTPTTNGDFNLTSISDANLMVRFIGRNAGDQAGFSVSGAGDTNNDGYDDVLLQGVIADGGGSDSGEVYLVLGRSTANWDTLTDASGNFNLDNMSDANMTVRFFGRNAFDYMGHCVYSAGDINNDGYNDTAIGAVGADGGGSASGEAYVIFGRSTTNWATLTDASGDFNMDNI